MTWRKLPGSRREHKRASYEHASGWQIHHCGHPTALWPYYLTAPAPGADQVTVPIIVSYTGRGFQHLAEAQAAVAYILLGQLEYAFDATLDRSIVSKPIGNSLELLEVE